MVIATAKQVGRITTSVVECWSQRSGQGLRKWSAARLHAPDQLLPDKPDDGGSCETQLCTHVVIQAEH
jgi:hypothetical protein